MVFPIIKLLLKVVVALMPFISNGYLLRNKKVNKGRLRATISLGKGHEAQHLFPVHGAIQECKVLILVDIYGQT